MRQPRRSLHFSAKVIALIVMPWVFTACTSAGEVAVKVDSISHQVVPITGKRLFVDLNEGAGNLFRENEIATKIMHTLAARGYAQAETLAEADYRLEFSYGFQKLPNPSVTSPAVLVSMGLGTTPRYKGHLTLRVLSISTPSQPLWVGEANGSQQSPDMHSMIDYLIAAAVNHLGENMSRPVSYTFSDTDTVSSGVIPRSDE